MNAILKFPTFGDAGKKRDLVDGIRPELVLQAFSREDAHALLGVARKVERGISVLMDLVDGHREVARVAGVESVAIELFSERKNLGRILDALEESERKKSGVELSLEGLEMLRRTEKLVAEAESNVARFSTPGRPASLRASSLVLSSDPFLWGTLAFGAVTLVAVIIAIAFSGKSTPGSVNERP